MKRSEHRFVPYSPEVLPDNESVRRGEEFFAHMDKRRSVRHFSNRPVPKKAIEHAIRAASTAPSGAHRQPWTFVAISDPEIKSAIRIAAEAEEHRNYEGGRMPPEWVEALTPLGTDWRKPYLEVVPYIVVVFEQTSGFAPNGEARKNYYVKESVGIACGLFIAALHSMGLCTLTHTPSPMGFLRGILGRPKNERPYILFPVGYAASDAVVPDLTRRRLEDVAIWNPTPES